MGFQNTWCGHCAWFIGNKEVKSSINRMLVENLTSKLACGKVAFAAPDFFFMFIGSGIEEMARTIARWWIGLRRPRYPTVGRTLCWWHYAVCYCFRWSSPDAGCIGSLCEGGRKGTKAQPGKTLTTQNGLEMKIFDALVINIERWQQRSWCGLPSAGYFKSILCEQIDFVWQKCFFELSYHTFWLCGDFRFGAGQRKLYKSEFLILMRTAVNLLRQVVGPTMHWLDENRGTPFFHQWNQRVVEQMQLNGCKLCSKRCMIEYWKFVQYVAVFDDSRWLKRALVRNAGGGRLGRSFDLWETFVTKFCRWQNIGKWEGAAQDKALWMQYTEHFINFNYVYGLSLTPRAPKGCRTMAYRSKVYKNNKTCSIYTYSNCFGHNLPGTFQARESWSWSCLEQTLPNTKIYAWTLNTQIFSVLCFVSPAADANSFAKTGGV